MAWQEKEWRILRDSDHKIYGYRRGNTGRVADNYTAPLFWFLL